jgi:hypothetical protein
MGDDGAVQTCQINTTNFAVAYEFLLKDKISEDPDTYDLIPKKLPQQSEEKEMNDLPNTDFFYYKFIYSGTDKLDISYEWSGGGKDFELRKTKNHIKIKIMHWAQ